LSYASAYGPVLMLRSKPFYPPFLSHKAVSYKSGILRHTRY